MKLLLLVSLPLLASTNVTLAKSTLNEGRQNVTDSLDMSPRAIRNLKQDTTAGTRHQGENAEERAPNPTVEKLALKLAEEAPAVVGRSRSFEEKHGDPETLFSKLDFTKKDELFGSQAFREWVQAVERSNGEDSGRIIIDSLLQKISKEKLAEMVLYDESKALSDKEFGILYDGFMSHFEKQGGQPMAVRPSMLPHILPEPGTPLALFRELEYQNNENLFRSEAFKKWMLAVEKSDEQDVARTIRNILRDNIPKEELMPMLMNLKGGALTPAERVRLYIYVLSHILDEP